VSTIFYEDVIIENRNLRADWLRRLPFPSGFELVTSVPEGVTSGVDPETYSAYRKGRDSACVDLVITTELENGEPAVMLSLRSKDVCFGGKWWVYGGALQAYESIDNFISDRAKRECGVEARPQALIGVYRTCAEDFVGSTLNLCYMTFVQVETLRAFMATDDRHQRVALFSTSELSHLDKGEQHWYPMRVARLALEALP
jgi:ADP-ribose pyrophosphatase YjhB (NUDIX family)